MFRQLFSRQESSPSAVDIRSQYCCCGRQKLNQDSWFADDDDCEVNDRTDCFHLNRQSMTKEPETVEKVVVGVCAMERKAHGKPMTAIIAELLQFYGEWLDIRIFDETTILHEPIEAWPLCDGLISFYSKGFPLEKAMAYVELRNPFVINDLHAQFHLLDRQRVYEILERAGIEHPRNVALIRNAQTMGVLNDHGDSIEVNGSLFQRPFVEKPLSAEDHQVRIYYHSSVGGGCQRLFRKVNNRSSTYVKDDAVRTEGSYVYEEFLQAVGTDVKVYAVGPFYAHAEARKSPALDGWVERDEEGKEIRYPVILSPQEKQIAHKIVLAFGQTVCGFDLLRANGRSYVCDVNGFSFVKSSTKYYEDTALILGNMILGTLANRRRIPWRMPKPDDERRQLSTSGRTKELRCVLAVIRHGDRTPKQKLKTESSDPRFFDLFAKYDGYANGEVKMKKPQQLSEVLELAHLKLIELRRRLDDIGSDNEQDERRRKDIEDGLKVWDQVRSVLEMYGHFSGINRKCQLKYQQEDATRKTPSLRLVLKWGGELTTAGNVQAEALGKWFRTLYPARRGEEQTSEQRGASNVNKLGRGFLRLHSTYSHWYVHCCYIDTATLTPLISNTYALLGMMGNPTSVLNLKRCIAERLATFAIRHDLKIYASDEGRVQMTAAAFTKGLLALEGELPPILAQMVRSANTDGLLDSDHDARKFQADLKQFLYPFLQMDRTIVENDHHQLNPSNFRSIRGALNFINHPRKMCDEILGHVSRMCEIIRYHKRNRPGTTLYLQESWQLAESRWEKLFKEFCKPDKKGTTKLYDISKIPDIYDNVKYDMEHNPELCMNFGGDFERMYMCVKNMADVVVPQEYGIRKDGKLSIAQRVCTPLISKLKADLRRCVEGNEEDEMFTRLDPRASEGITSPSRNVRTRLYFTSESHLHSLMNIVRLGGLITNDKKWTRALKFISGVTELNYMTQLVIMLYENRPTSNPDEGMAAANGGIDDQFYIELLFSPGLYPCFEAEKERLYEDKARETSESETPANGDSSTASSITADDFDSDSTPGRGSPATPTCGGTKWSERLTDGAADDGSTANEDTLTLVSLNEIGVGAPTSPHQERQLAHESVVVSRRMTAPPISPIPEHSSPIPNIAADGGKEMVRNLSETLLGAAKSRRDIERLGSEGANLPYRFKTHAVNYLKEFENKLISNDVISGSVHKDGRKGSSPALLNTAVISQFRQSRDDNHAALTAFLPDEQQSLKKTRIKRFWPPLRSLEYLHDHIPYQHFDDFCNRIITLRSPMPTPPKTPANLDENLRSPMAFAEETLEATATILTTLKE